MDWFNQALETVKKGAEELGENARNLGETVQKQATDGVSKLRETIAEGDLQRAFDMGEGGAQPEEDVTPEDLPPWEVIPQGWEVRRKEWRILVQGLCLDENTFLVGPAGREEHDYINFTRDEVSAKCQIASAAYEPLESVRFGLSPKYVSETDFWLNFAWKARELAKCSESNIKLESILRELNTDPKGILPDGERKRNRGIAHDKDVIAEIVKLVKAEEENTKRLADMVRVIKEEVKTSEENAALLTRILGRGNSTSTDLKDSVYESCRYHRQKVAQLEEQGQDEAEENRLALPLDMLQQAASALDSAIDIYEKGSQPGPSAASPPTAGQVPDATTAPQPPPEAASPSQADADVAQPATLSEDYFGGALPWEDDATGTPDPATAPATEDVSSPWEDTSPTSSDKQ